MAEKESKGLFSFLKKNDDYEDEYDYDDEELDDGYDEMTPLPKYQANSKVENLGQSMASGVNGQVKVMFYEPAQGKKSLHCKFGVS